MLPYIILVNDVIKIIDNHFYRIIDRVARRNKRYRSIKRITSIKAFPTISEERIFSKISYVTDRQSNFTFVTKFKWTERRNARS